MTRLVDYLLRLLSAMRVTVVDEPYLAADLDELRVRAWAETYAGVHEEPRFYQAGPRGAS